MIATTKVNQNWLTCHMKCNDLNAVATKRQLKKIKLPHKDSGL